MRIRSYQKIFLSLFFISYFLSSSLLFAQNSTFESKFTNLTSCKKLPPEGITQIKHCPGLDGYEVFWFESHDTHRGDDLTTRYLSFKKDSTFIELRSMSELWLGIPSGAKLEWRYKISNGKKDLIAWIFRNGDTLNIIRLEAQNKKWCLLGQAKTNEEAHTIADSDKTCGGITIFGLY